MWQYLFLINYKEFQAAQNCSLQPYTEKNDSLNLLNFFKISGCNQFILATFK